MKIHDGGHSIRSHIQAQQLQAATEKKSGQTASTVGSNLTSVETNSTQNLKSLLGGSDVRETLVQEIKLKLQAGEYATQKAIYDTADAILNL